jgi:hypothetical protein
LLGLEASTVLSVAVAEYGCVLEDLRAAEVDVHPSGAVIVLYAAGVRRGDGTRVTEFLGATSWETILAEEEFIMERPASWKVVTIGTALAGLSVAGGPGAARSDSGSSGSGPASVSPAPLFNEPRWLALVPEATEVTEVGSTGVRVGEVVRVTGVRDGGTLGGA